MYRFIIRRQIRAAFRALSRGDAPALLAHMSPDVHHTFPATPMKPCARRSAGIGARPAGSYRSSSQPDPFCRLSETWTSDKQELRDTDGERTCS